MHSNIRRSLSLPNKLNQIHEAPQTTHSELGVSQVLQNLSARVESIFPSDRPLPPRAQSVPNLISAMISAKADQALAEVPEKLTESFKIKMSNMYSEMDDLAKCFLILQQNFISLKYDANAIRERFDEIKELGTLIKGFIKTTDQYLSDTENYLKQAPDEIKTALQESYIILLDIYQKSVAIDDHCQPIIFLNDPKNQEMLQTFRKLDKKFNRLEEAVIQAETFPEPDRSIDLTRLEKESTVLSIKIDHFIYKVSTQITQLEKNNPQDELTPLLKFFGQLQDLHGQTVDLITPKQPPSPIKRTRSLSLPNIHEKKSTAEASLAHQEDLTNSDFLAEEFYLGLTQALSHEDTAEQKSDNLATQSQVQIALEYQNEQRSFQARISAHKQKIHSFAFATRKEQAAKEILNLQHDLVRELNFALNELDKTSSQGATSAVSQLIDLLSSEYQAMKQEVISFESLANFAKAKATLETAASSSIRPVFN